MKSARAIGPGLLLWLAAVAQAGGLPASGSSAPHALQRQLHRTQTELQRQRAQTDQLRARVDALEKRSADNRAQLDQRDRRIVELQRQLDALSASPRPVPAPGGSH